MNDQTTMKKILYILFLFFTTTLAIAQDDDGVAPPQDTKAREKINAARAAYITERLGLTPEEAEKFWPVYREFTDKRQELRQQYRQAKKNGTDEKTLLDLDLKIKQQELDLEKNYSGRMLSVISPQKLMTLRQAEGDFRRLLLRQIEQRQMHQERRQHLKDRSQQRLLQRNN
jgi:hypothetical protein